MSTEQTIFQKLVAFLSKHGWKGFIGILLACAAALVMSYSCSTVKSGYSRYRDIHQTDSTYIEYNPAGFAESSTRVRTYQNVRTRALSSTPDKK